MIKSLIKKPIIFLLNNLRKKEIVNVEIQEVLPQNLLKGKVALVTGGG